MNDILKTFFAVSVALALIYLLWQKLQQARARATATPDILFSNVKSLFENVKIEPGQTNGSWKLTGTYRDSYFQLQIITDTLSTRKLPSLWLMLTLPTPQNISGVIDMMIRPAGPSTFSNFDFLSFTLPTPNDFPEHAVIRTNDPKTRLPVEAIHPHLALLKNRHTKELLIAPKGLRIVTMLAEAERARYGVFREADFGEIGLELAAVQQILDTLIALDKELNARNA